MIERKLHDRVITIGLGGDVMIGRLVNDYLDEVPSNYVWGNLIPLLQSTDLNLINLEAALTKSEHIVPKVFNFKADPEKVQVLIDGSIDVVNLANNHVLDFAKEGLIETLSTLDKIQILHVGAGENAAKAAAPVIITRNGIRIGILGCTDNEPTWIAKEDHPGIRYIDIGDRDAIRQDILQLRPKVDLLILSMHWGPNMRERPTFDFKQFAHRLIELGVDVIHGHSAHIFQGIEVYKGKLILYDTGDFVDDYYVDPILRNDRSFFFLLEADKTGLRRLRLMPVLISNFQVNKVAGEDADETLKRMQHLSKELHTNLERVGDELVLHFPGARANN